MIRSWSENDGVKFCTEVWTLLKTASIGVKFGEFNLKQDSAFDTDFYYSSNIFMHPEYNDVDIINDVCLIYIHNDIEFNDYVDIACLPDGGATGPEPGTECFIAGWGVEDYDADVKPAILRRRFLQVGQYFAPQIR